MCSHNNYYSYKKCKQYSSCTQGRISLSLKYLCVFVSLGKII